MSEDRNTVEAQNAERMTERKVFMPRADVYETADGVIVEADMPGVDEKSLDITVENDVLTIRGKVDAVEYPGFKPAYAEYETGDYERAFTLSQDIDRERIDASIRNGVLRLALPKATQARAHKIAVKAQ
jgi:HSP20 family protein